MTLLLNTETQNQPGTHVLAIGVGSYPHLLGGNLQIAGKPLGLRQLESPPASLVAFLQWFMGSIQPAANAKFCNPQAPLASVEALASAEAPVVFETAVGPHHLEPATRQNIDMAFARWLDRAKSHPDNIAVLYFCGHGLMAADHFLLAEDFGANRLLPWNNAFDISNTMRALDRELDCAVYYFIDACREVSRDIALSMGAAPTALLHADLTKRVIRQSVSCIYATGEGELAHAPAGPTVSYFTEALIGALSGYCGIKAPGSATWNVDGETLAAAVRLLLQRGIASTERSAPRIRQVIDQSISGRSAPLQKSTVPPQVKVSLDLTPGQRRALYELYLQRVGGGQRHSQLLNDCIFEIEVPRGVYEVGAVDPAGGFPNVVHYDEDLIPPTYTLILESLP